uniref:ABC transporter substrate-binding protein n=1 Tax=Candidatus Caldatribacterium saccharofermentans TaxID=1454753 RepID=A0A7V4TKF1_9BACT
MERMSLRKEGKEVRRGFALFIAWVVVIGLVTTAISLAQEYPTFEVHEIIQYKALPQYSEAPELAEAVARGELPPVEERLPKKPAVIMTSGMSDGPGVYGDVWRTVSAVPTAGWNWAAGVVGGWFGIEECMQEGLVHTGMAWRLKTGEPGPNLATHWEWSEDGKTLTMYLIEGAKWSDGHPFTADDVLFTYYDCILDPHVPSWQGAGTWTVGGEVAQLEKVDDYTIRWHFAKPFPVYLLWYMGYLNFSVAPAHVLKPYHPKYNPEKTYEDFINALPPHKLPPVVLGAWVPVYFKEDEALIMKRNPYYWKVDETGKQLPYIGEFYFRKARAGIQRDLDLVAGTCDQTHLETPGIFTFISEQARLPGARFKIIPGRWTLTFALELNLSLYQGVKDERDRALRELFRNLEFRKAVSHAIDRETIARTLVPGPMLRPLPSGFPSGADYYNAEAVVSYPYNPEKARELLAGLGFRDTDGDGILNWTSGPLAGENLTISVKVHEDQTACIDIVEMLVSMFEAVGIRLVPKVVPATVGQAMDTAGEFEFNMARQDFLSAPYTVLASLAPVTAQTPNWHRAGPGDKRDLLPFEARMIEIVEALKYEVSYEKRKELFSELQKLWTENLYTIGVIEGIYNTAITKRFKNIPIGVPARLHQWFHLNVMQEQVWTPKEEQLPEFLPGVIVKYSKD